MSNYCKTIERIYRPTIIPPQNRNPLEADFSKLLWKGTYNAEGTSTIRGTRFLPSMVDISMEEREKSFNKYLMWRYRNY